MNELAYIGAIVDGEGCLCIRKKSSKFFQSVITITSKDEGLIRFINSIFPAPIHIKKEIYYVWFLTGCSKIENFLNNILPYLLIKREQGELLLKFVKLRKDILRKPRYSIGYTREEISLYEQIKKLKKQPSFELPSYNFANEEKLYYLAGLIDGEGSVRIAKAVHKNAYGNEKLILTPQISIANTDKRLMEFLKKEFCGFYHTKKREIPKRTIYQWYMQGLKEDFFKALNGRLIIKQKQLSLILDYIESRKVNYTRENEIDIFLKIKELNNKGKENYAYENLKQYTSLVRNPRKFFITKDELNGLYWNEGLSIRQIAKKFGVKYNSVYGRMNKYNISRRAF